MKFTTTALLSVLLLVSDFQATAADRRAISRRTRENWSYRHPQWNQHGFYGVYDQWYGLNYGWPAYYAYYGTNIYGSSYLYSYPLNSTYYYSYPSYYRNYVFPSYPYNGSWYVNGTKIHRPYPFYQRYGYERNYPIQERQFYNGNSQIGVFLSE